MSLPPSEIPAGAMRFNSDSQKLEYWNGSAWFQVHTAIPNLGTSADTQPGVRGIIYNGELGSPSSGNTNEIDYYNISSLGNTTTFGTSTQARRGGSAAASSSTRGLSQGGYVGPTSSNVIDFITFSSTGDAQDFGDLNSTTSHHIQGFSNQTRGLFAGGYRPSSGSPSNAISYVTIASTGDAADFGDLTRTVRGAGGQVNSPTRAVLGGGAPSTQVTMDFMTIATLGDAQDFGDLTVGRDNEGGGSNATRGIYAGGRTPLHTNTIDYITISSTGNATNFGDTLAAGYVLCGGTGTSPTRMVIAGMTAPTITNVMQYLQIQTQGNTVDFGDLSKNKDPSSNFSNAHGGL